ncbi:MAG: ATPase domain-containing protein, partial [Candidatus Thermoplasmatota archaeon]
MKEKEARVKTYVKGLDERLSGGMPKESIILVCGTASSMKSSFVYSILYNNTKNENINGLYITMGQSAESLLSHTESLGMGKLEGLHIFDLAGMRAQYGDLLSRKLVTEAREIAPGIPETGMNWF